MILARDRDSDLAELDLRALDAAGAEEACDRIAKTGALEEVRTGARERVAGAKQTITTCNALAESQRRLLSLVADGVVERYA